MLTKTAAVAVRF